MKRIQLAIPKPCHENWDAMTPNVRGKFCASCQKAVIDFTQMSDRQLADFFRKPPSSVCGRVYDDQLRRDIVIAKKRIPWTKYFFQFTWPAFVFLLKSCGVKENLKGKIKIESEMSREALEPMISVGVILPGQEVTILQTASADTSNPGERKIGTQNVTKGEIAVEDTIRNQEVDSAKILADTSLPESIAQYKPMDTVVVSAKAHNIILGGISVCTIQTIQTKRTSVKSVLFDKEHINFKVYPNPVRSGSSLTISFESADVLPKTMQILSSSGQLISQVKQNEKEINAVTNIQIPPNIPAGIYFLQALAKNAQVQTTKIIVTN